MTKKIWFDMDGTIADLYGVENWLQYLINEDTTPYKIAKPLMNFALLARILNKLIRNGYSINVVTWTAKNGSLEYNNAVGKAKIQWLHKHLKSVKFDRIDVIPYGTPKEDGRSGILFDDNAEIRAAWNGKAYNVNNIIKELKEL